MLIEGRIMLCYVVMSFLALCANIYQNPEDPKAAIDLKLMKIVTNFLSLLKNDDKEAAAYHLLRICAEFERLARRAVKNAQEKQALDIVHNQTPPSSSASNHQTTPASPSGTTQINGFPPDTESSIFHGGLPANGMPQDLSGSSAFGAPESTRQRQSSLLFDPENADAFQPSGTGTEEMDFTVSTILPEYTGAASSSDFWQLPMPLEWNWADMTANYFPAD
jgi:hypothetical protein